MARLFQRLLPLLRDRALTNLLLAILVIIAWRAVEIAAKIEMNVRYVDVSWPTNGVAVYPIHGAEFKVSPSRGATFEVEPAYRSVFPVEVRR